MPRVPAGQKCGGRRRSRSRDLRARVAGVALLLAAPGCASAPQPPPAVNLAPAREALEAARRAGAAEQVPDALERAEAHLKEAETLLAAPGNAAADQGREAAALSRLAASEATCAASLATARTAAQRPDTPPTTAAAPLADLEARLERSEEEQRRLEDRVGLLLKELELTETEVIHTKAKVKGQTRAEASSAIAETRILLRRLSDEKLRSPNFARCQELLERAEGLIGEDNFGGAAFLAMTAQDLLEQTRRLAADPAALDRPAPKKQYVVAADSVNIRKAPSTTAPIVGRAPRGAALDAGVVRGDWVKVTHSDVVGWAYRPLLQ